MNSEINFGRDDNMINSMNEDIRFDYNDTDLYHIEIAASSSWTELKSDKQKSYLNYLLDRFELRDSKERMIAARSLLYILQGNFRSCELEEDQINWTRRNVYMCLEVGILNSILNLLLIEIDIRNWGKEEPTEGSQKSQRSMTDCLNLRIVLSILYILVETVRTMNDSKGYENFSQLKKQFLAEINQPLLEDKRTTLTILLFGMIHKFCSAEVPSFPLKKILLLLWKVLLLTLGPISEIFALKNQIRKRFNLKQLDENNVEIVKHLRTCCPSDNSGEISVPRLSRIANRQGQGIQEPKSGSLSGGRLAFQKNASLQMSLKKMKINDSLDSWPDNNGDDAYIYDDSGEDSSTRNNSNKKQVTYQERNSTPLPSEDEDSSLEDSSKGSFDSKVKNDDSSYLMAIDKFFNDHKFDEKTQTSANHLPWKLKVKHRDIVNFIDTAREKFLNLKSSHEDIDSLIGLPQPIKDAVKILKDHLHISIGELQVKLEEDILLHPFSKRKDDLILDENVERLYREIYQMLPQYLISLLKILLAASPTFRNPATHSNFIYEVLPAKQQSNVIQSFITNTDIDRHREIIVKAVSAILLTLLKRLKLNHIYQFEYAAQHLIFANYIPLVLKFFNPGIESFVMKKHSISILEFPTRFIGKMEEIPLDSLCVESNSYSNRNLFVCINLLRILNSLIKWKPCRAGMMVAFKSAPILIKILKVRQPMLQFYVLKLLKLQSRYLGRQWRKNNMTVMSAIYQKVRHRLTDDWAYANDIEQRPQDLHVDEVSIRLKIDKFNQRRYSNDWIDKDFLPVDNTLASALNVEIKLSDEFKNNYEKWLEEEVFSSPINWDDVLTVKCH